MIVNGYEIKPNANLTFANLTNTDLRGANLTGAILTRANLTFGNLSRANLTNANLTFANLTFANLTNTDLRGANLTGAILSRANLTGTILIGAILRYVDLRYVNLTGAVLTDADLTGAKLPHFQICPEEGSFVGWKKLRGGRICKLLIPAEARRTSTLVGRKCRAEFVQVLEGSGYSQHNGEVLYSEGKIIKPDSYNNDIRIECTNGIHFFMTRREAEEY